MREIVKNYGLQAQKKLGQNFLFDLNLTSKITRYAGKLDTGTIIEIGPGPGALTRALLANGAKQVIAIDPDTRCLNALTEYLLPAADGRLTLMEGDALKMDVGTLGERPRKIVANLPYNVATPLLFQWLEKLEDFDGFTLMFQKEVADRIAAEPRHKSYGRLSVMTQALCDVSHCFDIPPSAFYPPPKITSTVISIIPKKQPLLKSSYRSLELLCKTAFNQRRKVLRTSLKPICKEPLVLLEQLGVTEHARPEELSVEQFCELAALLEQQ